jgi:hypothetical protein
MTAIKAKSANAVLLLYDNQQVNYLCIRFARRRSGEIGFSNIPDICREQCVRQIFRILRHTYVHGTGERVSLAFFRGNKNITSGICFMERMLYRMHHSSKLHQQKQQDGLNNNTSDYQGMSVYASFVIDICSHTKADELSLVQAASH